MSFKEKLLYCNNCKKSFTFTVEDQEYRSSRGYPNDPVTCPACRRARNTRVLTHDDTDKDSGSSRQMFPVACTLCGKSVRVPFQPRPGRPVYCSACQMKTRVGR